MFQIKHYNKTNKNGEHYRVFLQMYFFVLFSFSQTLVLADQFHVSRSMAKQEVESVSKDTMSKINEFLTKHPGDSMPHHELENLQHNLTKGSSRILESLSKGSTYLSASELKELEKFIEFFKYQGTKNIVGYSSLNLRENPTTFTIGALEDLISGIQSSFSTLKSNIFSKASTSILVGAFSKMERLTIRAKPLGKRIISGAANVGRVSEFLTVPVLLYECSKDKKCHHDIGTYPSAVAADEFGASTYNYVGTR
ncbi:MAG: hypothetical protein ACXVCP_16425 [Bdellovibrio sp.]